ncbi:MAG: DUF559 domain-containing protein [Alphaproteobacteria bacterium]|nr:DUF559 domain-containing protein [Alphaproteobacteria bacterium]
MRNKPSIAFAKKLRRTMTRAELILWAHIRKRTLGHRFRRQHPIGPFIADFACVAAKLVVEVDGATHATDAEIAADARRTEYLQSDGWRVLRVTNTDVYENLDGVWIAIESALAQRT